MKVETHARLSRARDQLRTELGREPTCTEVARLLGVSRQRVCKLYSQLGWVLTPRMGLRPYTPEEDALIMCAPNLHEAAEQLGRTRKAVAQQRYRIKHRVKTPSRS